MFGKFVLKKGAVEKLGRAGLKKRIEEVVRSDTEIYGYNHAVYSSDIKVFREIMEEKGVFDVCGSERLSAYMKALNGFLRQLEKPLAWVVERPEGRVAHPASLADFTTISGYLASYVLTPEEFWDNERFGFESLSDFHGTVAAYLQNSHDAFLSFREGYTSETANHTQLQVTADMHGDLRIYRTDKTPYDTVDPLGNEVSYRPVLKEDREAVIAYHSTEPQLLAAITKYVAQEGIKSKLLKDGAKEFLGEVSGQSAYSGDSKGMFGRDDYKENYWHFEYPLPHLDEDNLAGYTSPYVVAAEPEFSYRLYVAPDKSLVFAYDGNSKPAGERDGRIIWRVVPSLRVPPDEIDHLIRGLFVETAKGCGRTHLDELVDGLRYRFSGELEKYLEKRSGGNTVEMMKRINASSGDGYL